MADDFKKVPQALRERGCIVWRYDQHGGKRPIAGWGKAVTPLSFDDAVGRVGEGDGIGVILGDGLGGVDLDACFNSNGCLKPWAEEVRRQFAGTYIERSPSGKGVKLFALGAPDYLSRCKLVMSEKAGGEKAEAIEAYVSGRWFAVTGEALPNSGVAVAPMPEAWAWTGGQLGARTKAPVASEPVVTVEPEWLEQALRHMDVGEYRDENDWLRLMMSCHRVTDGLGDDEFIFWSCGDPAYADHDVIIKQRWGLAEGRGHRLGAAAGRAAQD